MVDGMDSRIGRGGPIEAAGPKRSLRRHGGCHGKRRYRSGQHTHATLLSRLDQPILAILPDSIDS